MDMGTHVLADIPRAASRSQIRPEKFALSPRQALSPRLLTSSEKLFITSATSSSSTASQAGSHAANDAIGVILSSGSSSSIGCAVSRESSALDASPPSVSRSHVNLNVSTTDSCTTADTEESKDSQKEASSSKDVSGMPGLLPASLVEIACGVSGASGGVGVEALEARRQLYHRKRSTLLTKQVAEVTKSRPRAFSKGGKVCLFVYQVSCFGCVLVLSAVVVVVDVFFFLN
jgi:hypothetical protein